MLHLYRRQVCTGLHLEPYMMQYDITSSPLEVMSWSRHYSYCRWSFHYSHIWRRPELADIDPGWCVVALDDSSYKLPRLTSTYVRHLVSTLVTSHPHTHVIWHPHTWTSYIHIMSAHLKCTDVTSHLTSTTPAPLKCYILYELSNVGSSCCAQPNPPYFLHY